MKIIVANRDEYNNYFSKKTKELNTYELKDQKEYVVYRIELETGENDVSLMYSSINNLLEEQYERNSYIRLEELKEIDDLFHTLDKEQCKIINAYAEIKHYKIKSLNEVKELIANINDYQLFEKYNLEEVGKFITQEIPEYEVADEIEDFVDYSKLAKRYLFDSNIKENFCSYGLLVNTKEMLENDLIEEKITNEKLLRVLVVNRKEYQENPFYSKVTLYLPIDDNRLQEKLKQISIDYKNSSKEDTQILECSLVNSYDEKARQCFDFIMDKIIGDLEKNKNCMVSLQNIQELVNEFRKFDNIRMNKFVAIIEARADEISDFREVIKCAKTTKQYDLIPDVKNYEDMGRFLVYETAHFDDISILLDYVDFYKLGKEYTQKGCTYNGSFTDLGYVMKKEFLEEEKNNEQEDMEFGGD